MKPKDGTGKKMGRPKKYDGEGAPYLGLRLEPPIYNHIKSKPEGPRAYVERLVTEDAEKTGESLGGVAGEVKPGEAKSDG